MYSLHCSIFQEVQVVCSYHLVHQIPITRDSGMSYFHISLSTLHKANCTQQTAYSKLHTAHCTKKTAHNTMHTWHCILYSEYCTLHSTDCRECSWSPPCSFLQWDCRRSIMGESAATALHWTELNTKLHTNLYTKLSCTLNCKVRLPLH